MITNLALGGQALERFIQTDWTHCLDIGSGPGLHAEILRKVTGRRVTTMDLAADADICAPWPDLSGDQWDQIESVDAVWCCHVLEHTTNPGGFLEAIAGLAPRVLAVTVPPAKHNLVGGHVTIWNEGLLLYQMVLAGFDCRDARVGVYGYNLSVILDPVRWVRLPPLKMDAGDLEILAPLFPVHIQQNLDGRIGSVRW